MKGLIIASLLSVLPLYLWAQDDALYFTPSKNEPVPAASQRQTSARTSDYTRGEVVDYGVNRRSEDEYNRRYANYGGSYASGEASADTILQGSVTDVPDDDRQYDEDYYFSRRILRFHSPRLGIALSSPWYWDMVYGYGVYDYLYDDFYVYDPFFWNYGWGYGWSWGPWSSWYGPIWGWRHPSSWYYWGWGYNWGPGWSYSYPVRGSRGWDRGTFSDRGNYRGERIRTSALANGGNAALSRGTFATRTSAQSGGLATQRTAALNQSTRGLGRADGVQSRTTTRGSYSDYARSRQSATDASTYNRPSSTRSTYERARTSVQQQTQTRTPVRTETQVTIPRSNTGSFGGSTSGGSFGGSSRGGGSVGGGGGVSRGGGRR